MNKQAQNLNINLKQQLSLTPQLQQAIKILNMNQQDLQVEIAQMLTQKFMLELDDHLQMQRVDSEEEAPKEGLLDELNAELEYDCEWEEVYDSDWHDHAPYREQEIDFDAIIEARPALLPYLREQLQQMPLSPEVLGAAEAFISHLDEDGYLREKCADLAQQYRVKMPVAEAAIQAIKNCQPSGVGAFDLEDCLNLQIALLPENTPYLSVLKRIMTRHFLFIGKNPQLICNRLDLNESDYEQAVLLLKTLNPRPAQEFAHEHGQYIRPEVIVCEKGGISFIETDEHIQPLLRINAEYAKLTQSAVDQDKVLLQAQLNEARWFINAIDKRADTIQRVASVIVALQQDFFQEGEKAMQPLTRQKVAELLNVHESTVSRAVNGKYLMCKRGIFELRYFFSSQLETTDGEEQSSTAVKAVISEIVRQEDPKKPLSDQKIADILLKKGYKIARRTAAKYREELGIATSTMRRERS